MHGVKHWLKPLNNGVDALMKVMTNPQQITPNFSYEISQKNDEKGCYWWNFYPNFFTYSIQKVTFLER